MDADDYRWVAEKMAGYSRRKYNDLSKAEQTNRHPELLLTLKGEASRANRIAGECLQIAEEIQ